MDPRSPIPGTLIEGENARRERFAADRPFPFSPVESLLIVLVTLAAIAAVLWTFNAAQGAAV